MHTLDLVRGFINEGAYRSAYNTTKKCFKTSEIAELIKILFEFTRFFKVQKFIKNRIHFNHKQELRGELISGRGSL